MPNFINQALRNKKITIYGDGNQSRSFCYVTDLIDGLIKLMQMDNNFTGPVNLGSPNEIKILDLAKKIIDKIDSKSEIFYDKLPDDDPVRRKPDIHLAEKKLNWKPKIQLNIGLEETINYFSSLNNFDLNQRLEFESL